VLTKQLLSFSLAAMFMRLYDQSFMRRMMAVVATLFAMQLLLSSACLMAEASPITGTDATYMHMDHHVKAVPATPTQHEKYCCSFEQGKQAVSASLLLSLNVPFFVLNTQFHDDTGVLIASSFATARMPTGPPRSSSLLFSTTQRIRI
jgi:hypothetical protein